MKILISIYNLCETYFINFFNDTALINELTGIMLDPFDRNLNNYYFKKLDNWLLANSNKIEHTDNIDKNFNIIEEFINDLSLFFSSNKIEHINDILKIFDNILNDYNFNNIKEFISNWCYCLYNIIYNLIDYTIYYTLYILHLPNIIIPIAGLLYIYFCILFIKIIPYIDLLKCFIVQTIIPFINRNKKKLYILCIILLIILYFMYII